MGTPKHLWRQCDMAGGERVPLAPRDWYLLSFYLSKNCWRRNFVISPIFTLCRIYPKIRQFDFVAIRIFHHLLIYFMRIPCTVLLFLQIFIVSNLIFQRTWFHQDIYCPLGRKSDCMEYKQQSSLVYEKKFKTSVCIVLEVHL